LAGRRQREHRAERHIAQRPGERVPSHRRADQCAARAQHLRPDGVPLVVVGVEHPLLGATLDHRGELPRQVRRILQAGVHAHAARGRVHVRRVSGEQHPADAIPRHLALVAVEAGGPARLRHPEVAAEHPLHHAPDLLEIERILDIDLASGVAGDDAVPAVAERDHEHEAVAVAADREQVGRWVGQPHVGQHQRPDRRPAGEVQAEGVPHGGAVAVGADGEGRRRHGAPRARSVAARDPHAVGVLIHPGDLGALHDLDASIERALEEQPLDVERTPG
jgi:hypothetical protein